MTFTQFHVAISLIAIAAGFVMAFGLVSGRRLNGPTAVFLIFTVATTATGFLFPIHGWTPALIFGVISSVVLLICLLARYLMQMIGIWRPLYVITAMLAFYLNFFVLIAQSFQKIPALHALAPNGTEPPFAIAQGLALIFFIVITVLAVRRFRP